VSALYDPTALGHAHEMIKEALFMHEVLCRLGFAPAAIRIQLANTSTPELALFPERTRLYDVCIFVTLAAQGRTWRACVGPVGLDGLTFEKEWKKAVEAFNAAAHSDGQREWEQSRARNDSLSIERALVERGFQIPKAATVFAS
jgi:hypothetical protein